MGLNQTVQSHTQSYDPINARYLVCQCIECNYYVQIHFAEVNADQMHHTVRKQLVFRLTVLPSPLYIGYIPMYTLVHRVYTHRYALCRAYLALHPQIHS